MLYKNVLKLTNVKGITDLVLTYSSVSIRNSTDDPVKSVNVVAEFISNKTILKNHTIGSTVEVLNYPVGQPEKIKRLFYGVVTSVPKVLDGMKKQITFSAKCLLYKMQKIIVNGHYKDETISNVLNDLLSNTNFFTEIDIPNITTKTSFSFNDEYLYDAVKKVCDAVDYSFTADDTQFRVFLNQPVLNPVAIKRGMFAAGTANFTDDDSKLVNHIRGYAGNELTSFYKEETFIANGTNTDFYVKYPPSQSEVYLDDVRRTLGIQYIDTSGKDVYMDYSQKLYQFAIPPESGKVVKIRYKYYQKIIVEDSNGNSIDKYGLRMEVIKGLDYLTDRASVRQYLREYLAQYSEPITTGSITPLSDQWNVNDFVHIDIADLAIDKMLVCTEKDINLSPSTMEIQLQFQQRPDLVNVLKNYLDRIRQLEKASTSTTDDQEIDRYSSVMEEINVNENVSFLVINRLNSFRIGVSEIGAVI